jgi:hypothetical protein
MCPKKYTISKSEFIEIEESYNNSKALACRILFKLDLLKQLNSNLKSKNHPTFQKFQTMCSN